MSRCNCRRGLGRQPSGWDLELDRTLIRWPQGPHYWYRWELQSVEQQLLSIPTMD